VRLVLAAAVWVAAIWGFVLLDRSPDFVPWLRYLVLAVGLIAGGLMIAANRIHTGALAATLAILAGLAGPLAYTVDTVATAKQGSIISAGPRVAGEFGPGGMGGPGQRGQRGGGGGMGMPGGPNGMPGMPGGTGQYSGGGMGGPGGLLNGSRPSAAMVDHLTRDADQFTWMAAAVGSNEASGYQLDTGYSVMPIGGFNGTDPSPTLEQFQKLVAERKIHFFISGGRGFGPGGGSDTDRPSSQIRTWVTENFTSTTIDGVAIYDLTSPK
jgi:hypothetical protein